MKEKKPFGLWILARIAIRWLRGGFEEDKSEIVSTKRFILKAERKHERDPMKGIEIVSTFSVHRKIKNSDQWRYDKYLVGHDGKYTYLRGGLYPYDWE